MRKFSRWRKISGPEQCSYVESSLQVESKEHFFLILRRRLVAERFLHLYKQTFQGTMEINDHGKSQQTHDILLVQDFRSLVVACLTKLNIFLLRYFSSRVMFHNIQKSRVIFQPICKSCQDILVQTYDSDGHQKLALASA